MAERNFQKNPKNIGSAVTVEKKIQLYVQIECQFSNIMMFI